MHHGSRQLIGPSMMDSKHETGMMKPLKDGCTWKKANCLVFVQKKGCFKAVLALGLRQSNNIAIRTGLNCQM